MSKYVFITNSTKPTKEQYESLESVQLDNVSRPCLEIARDLGYDVVLGVNRKYAEKLKCNELDIKFYNSHTFRNIFAFREIYTAYKNLCQLLDEGDVDVIHCNSPIGGFIGRVCGRKYKVKKVIYTAHGFHFYKGASFFNNTILKAIEYFLARWTDVIITINEEDYQAAKKMKLKKQGKVYKINGVGINIDDFKNIELDLYIKRAELGLNLEDFICIATGDLIKRKNFKTAIEAISLCCDKKIHYLICGVGPEFNNLRNLAKDLDIEDQVHFLGYRLDIKELLMISNCFLFTSIQEGLPRSLMEAMAAGLPCIATNIRGNKDLLSNGEGGYLIDINKNNCFISLKTLMKNPYRAKQMGTYNKKVIKKYSYLTVYKQLSYIYKKELI